MKVWVYVEGASDRLALEALWEKWRSRLKQRGWGIHVIPLDDKSRFFRKIGPRAAQQLIADPQDLVVGMPDYYPNQPYNGTPYQHQDMGDLIVVQRQLVSDALRQRGADAEANCKRFFPSALKHDLEMLLLAACEQLRGHLDVSDQLGNWRHPVEDQNQQTPPKRIVEQLYLQKKHRRYRDTRDAAAVLGKVSDLRQLLYSDAGQLECPVFKGTLDWIGSRTGVAAY
jgi:hypothetical protein